MPIYTYHCEACGVTTDDVVRSMKDESAELCSRCSTPMERTPTYRSTDLREYHKPIEMYSASQWKIRPRFGRSKPNVLISI